MVVPSDPLRATFSSADIPFDEDTAHLLVNVQAVSGAGATMVITLEGKDEDGAYLTLATLAGITAISKGHCQLPLVTRRNTGRGGKNRCAGSP